MKMDDKIRFKLYFDGTIESVAKIVQTMKRAGLSIEFVRLDSEGEPSSILDVKAAGCPQIQMRPGAAFTAFENDMAIIKYDDMRVKFPKKQ